MKITDWNDLQGTYFPCCDCIPFGFNIPTEAVNQFQRGYGSAIGFTNPQDSEEDQANKIYLVRKTTYKNDSTIQPPKNPAGHVTTETYTVPYYASISNAAGSKQISTTKQEVKESGGDSFKGPPTIEYLSPLTKADAKAALKEMILAEIDFEQDSFEAVATNFNSSIEGGLIEGDFSINITHGRLMVRKNNNDVGNPFVSSKWFNQEWILYLIPSSYNTYLLDWNNYLNEKKAHDKWEKCMIEEPDPAVCGNEPITPEKPEPPINGPKLLDIGRYDFANGSPADSGWVEIPLTDPQDLGPPDVWGAQMENVFVTAYRHRSGNVPRLITDRYIDPLDPIPT